MSTARTGVFILTSPITKQLHNSTQFHLPIAFAYENLTIDGTKARNIGVPMAKSFVCLLVLIGILLSGCATLGTGSSQRSVEKGISLINSGDVRTLMEHTAIPFVFDGEILMRSGDVRILWENLGNNDFAIEDVSGITTSPVSADSFRLFSDAKEVEFFFQKYVPEETYTANITSSSGDFVMLFGEMEDGYPQILGIAGPKE